ncbi:MAG: hypothetical protein ACUVTX_08365 [Bacteroidales bacterium]
MKSSKLFHKILLLSLILITVLPVTVVAQDKKVKPSGEGSTVMAYDPPAGKSLAYSLSTSVIQMMDIEGQSVNVFINTNLGYKAKMTGKTNDNLNIEITVDSLNMNIDAMGNTTGRNISEVAGKSFNMIISETGKVIDASEASHLEYSVEGQGNVNMGETFRSVFPTLPGKSVKPGETWTIKDTVQNQTAGARVLQISDIEGKYEGDEIINGINCAKIVSTIKGTMETRTQNQGMDIFLHGPVSGQSVTYFAIKEGYVLKEDATSKVNGTVEISGPTSMSVPLVMNISSKLQIK